jgi:hypothetical protein
MTRASSYLQEPDALTAITTTTRHDDEELDDDDDGLRA